VSNKTKPLHPPVTDNHLAGGRGGSALKPGGWIEFQDISPEPLCDDGTMAADDPIKYLYELVKASFAQFGMAVTLPKVLGPRLREAGFASIHRVVKKVPVGDWARDETLRRIGMYQRTAVLEFLPALAGRPFEALGMPPVERQVAVALARRGLQDHRVHRYFEYYFWYAQKPLSPR